MAKLSQESCTACRPDAPAVKPEEMETLLEKIPGWKVEQRESVFQLERVFSFKNFQEALAFTNKVGQLAEQENHHPSLLTEWGKVRVTWWTHKIRGLHRNDFIMAARCDLLSL